MDCHAVAPPAASALIPDGHSREADSWDLWQESKSSSLPASGPLRWLPMMLADMGATVLRIDRAATADLGIPVAEQYEFTRRSRAVDCTLI